MNMKKAIIFFKMLFIFSFVIGEDLKINFSISSATPLTKNNMDLHLSLNSDKADGKIVFKVVNCTFEVEQKFTNDASVSDEDFPPKVVLKNGEGELKNLHEKKIVFHEDEKRISILMDETDKNLLVGPISGWISLLLSPATEIPESIMGLPIKDSDYNELYRDNGFKVISRKLAADEGKLFVVEERSIINIASKEKVFTGIYSKTKTNQSSQTLIAHMYYTDSLSKVSEDLAAFAKKIPEM